MKPFVLLKGSVSNTTFLFYIIYLDYALIYLNHFGLKVAKLCTEQEVPDLTSLIYSLPSVGEECFSLSEKKKKHSFSLSS